MAVQDVIKAWIEDQDWSELERPASVRALFETLVREHGFSGSYKGVVRFVRRRAPAPAVRPSTRRERTSTPTLAQDTILRALKAEPASTTRAL